MHVMLFQKLVLALSWKLSWGIHPVHSQFVPPERCATGVHAILARGQGPGDHLNVMVSIQNLILQLIPGSSSVALPYNHGAEDHRVAAADGGLMMQQYVREYVVSCPDSKIFLMGYSLVCAGHDPSSRAIPFPHSSQSKTSYAFLPYWQ